MKNRSSLRKVIAVSRSLSVATVALAALIATPAMAADLPVSQPSGPPPPLDITYRWGGFYIGMHGGGDWFNKDWFAPNTPTNSPARSTMRSNSAQLT